MIKPIIAVAILAPTAALSQSCEELTAEYSKYDVAAVFFDRSSKSENSTLRADTAQSALTNILIRQGMVLDMMIAKECDLPAPPEFQLLGMISGHN